MNITLIEKEGRYKHKVYLDDKYSFWLTWKELYFWNLKENGEINEETYKKIIKESIIPKAKRKALSYLEKTNRTEKEVRDKLKRELYLEDIIDIAIQYLNKYHYLDDLWVAENYIRANKNNHSRKWLEMKLRQKGIDKEQLDDLFAEEYSEQDAIKKEIKKRLKGKTEITKEEQNKLMAFLYRKGYSMREARKVMDHYFLK